MNPSATELPIPDSASIPPGQTTAAQESAYELTDEDLEILRAGLPESAKPREADCLTWWRELPRLLTSGQEGRSALVEGGKLISVWDTQHDAMQAGYDKFGMDQPFMTPRIEQTDLVRLKQYLAQERANCS